MSAKLSSLKLEDFEQFYFKVYNEHEYNKIEEICPKITDDNACFFLEVLIAIFEKKPVKEVYIKDVMFEIMNHYDVFYHYSKLSAVTQLKLIYYGVCEEVFIGNKETEDLKNYIMRSYQPESLIYIIKSDDVDVFITYLEYNNTLDANSSLFVPDSLYYQKFLKNKNGFLPLKCVAAFYGAKMIYAYLLTLSPGADEREFACSIIGDDIDLYYMCNNKFKSKYKHTAELMAFAHSNHLLHAQGSIFKVELLVYGLMFINLFFLAHVDITVVYKDEFKNYIKKLCTDYMIYPISKSENKEFANNLITVTHCNSLAIAYFVIIANILKYWTFSEVIEESVDDQSVNHYNVIQLKNKNAVEITDIMFEELDFLLLVFRDVSFFNMFKDCKNLQRVEFPSGLDTSSLVDTSGMFYDCFNLEIVEFPLSFDTSNVVDMRNMFRGCSSLSYIEFSSSFTTSKVLNMCNMFRGCSSFENIQFLRLFDTRKVTDMKNMFYGCEKLDTIEIPESFDTSNVKNMRRMFSKCSKAERIELPESFNTLKVKDMSFMFSDCFHLTNIEFNQSFNTSNVTTMKGMFASCSRLKNIDFNSFIMNTSKVTDMGWMFSDCSKLTRLIFPKTFILKNCHDMTEMFQGCHNLSYIQFSSQIDTSSVMYMTDIFLNCNKLSHISLPETTVRYKIANFIRSLSSFTKINYGPGE